MAINKVSKSNSSLVTLAELQTASAVFITKTTRASHAGPVITGGLVSQADIVKRGYQIQSIIARAIVNPQGSIFKFLEYLGVADEIIVLLIGNVFLADEFFITHNAPILLLSKGFNDAEPVLDNLELRIAAFRVFEDALRAQSRPALLLTKPFSDDQSLLDAAKIAAGYRRAATDIQNILDARINISIGKNINNAVTLSDVLAKDIVAARADQLHQAEAKYFRVGKTLIDGVMVRNHDDPGPALFVTKLLRDATSMIDLTGVFDGLTYQNIMYRFENIDTADTFSRLLNARRAVDEAQQIADQTYLLRGFNYADATVNQDGKNLLIGVRRRDDTAVLDALQREFLAQRVFEDTEIVAEVSRLTAKLDKQDVASITEQLARSIDKRNSDRVSISQRATKSAIKSLIDAMLQTDAIVKLMGLSITDAQTVTESVLFLLVTRRLFQDAVIASTQTKFDLSRILTDSFFGASQTSKYSIKTVDSQALSADHRQFFLGKQFSDEVPMLDLTGVFDGTTYNYIANKQDTAVVADGDRVKLLTSVFRTFIDIASISDVFAKARGIGFNRRTDVVTLADAIKLGKIPVDVLFIGSRLNQRSHPAERISFNIRQALKTAYRQLINDVNFFTGYQEYLTTVPTGQSFAGSTIFASTSASASVQVTSSGTGVGTNGGFVTEILTPYISFNGPSPRSLTTIPLDLTTVSSANITFSVIAGNNNNGGEQPDINEDLVIEYSTDAGATFVTAAMVYAIQTYAYSTWFEFTTSVPVAAQTTSTILRWRQSSQSLNAGDNYGIDNFRLGSTSFGTVISTYYDDNNANMVDRMIRGQSRTLSGDTARLIPIGYKIPIQLYEGWVQTNNALPNPDVFGSVVQVSSTGVWYATGAGIGTRAYRSTNGTSWTTEASINSIRSTWWKLGGDTTGNVLVSVMAPFSSGAISYYYSNNGGTTWNATTNIQKDLVSSRSQTGWPGAFSFPTSQDNVGVPLYIPARNAFISVYPSASGASYQYSSGGGATALGAAWSLGGVFPNSIGNTFPADGAGAYLTWTGGAHGNGVALQSMFMGYLSATPLQTIWYLADATPFPGNFATSTSISISFTGGFGRQEDPLLTSNIASQKLIARPALAFGAGRFLWIDSTGWVLTTTSPTVTASWASYRIQGDTSNGQLSSIVFDTIKQQFIIARNGTSTATAGFWYSTSGTQSSWTFKSAASLNFLGALNQSLSIFPGKKAVFTSGSTSISMMVLSYDGAGNISSTLNTWSSTVVGQLYTGNYVEAPTYNDIDRHKFNVAVTAKQGANKTVGAVTYGSDTPGDRILLGNSDYGIRIVTSTGTFLGIIGFPHDGNLLPNSENFRNMTYWGWGYNAKISTCISDKELDPKDGYAAEKFILGYEYPNYGLHLRYSVDISTPRVVSRSQIFAIWLKTDPALSGNTAVMSNFSNTGYPGQTITLTGDWQRYKFVIPYASITTTFKPAIQFGIFNDATNVYTGAGSFKQGDAIYIFGGLVIVGSTSDNPLSPRYIKTTTTAVAPGIELVNRYLTSYTTSAGFYNKVPIPVLVTSYLTLLSGNMWPDSQNLTTSNGWFAGRGYFGVSDVLAPDGTMTGAKVTSDGTNADGSGFYFISNTFPSPVGIIMTTGVTYTASMFFKGVGSSIGNTVTWQINQLAGGGSPNTSVVLTNEWQRVKVSFVKDTNPNYVTPSVYGGNRNEANLIVGQSVYVWGLQFTTGDATVATTYARTTGVAVLPATVTSTYVEYSYSQLYDYQPFTRSSYDADETVKFNIAQPRRELVEMDQRIYKNMAVTAYRGVAGAVTVKTRDSFGTGGLSSVQLNYGARSPDVVGTIDYILVTPFRSFAEISGDLDPFGNINTMVSQGTLRMTNYVGLDYQATDYVGESRSFT